MKWSLIVLGFFEGIIPAIFLFFVLPQLLILQKNLGTSSNISIIIPILLGLAVLASLLQIIIGVLYIKIKLTDRNIKLLVSLGIVMLILSIPTILLAIGPIYELITKIQ